MNQGKKRGLSFRYYSSNSNKESTIIFVHGFLGDSGVWGSYIQSLKDDYNILQIDLLGHGGSDTPSVVDEYSISNQAKIIADIATELAIGECYLFSYSYSFAVSIELLRNMNKQVKKLIVFSPYVLNRVVSRLVPIKLLNFFWGLLILDKRDNLDYKKISQYEKPKFKDRRYILSTINTKDVIGSFISLVSYYRKIELPIFIPCPLHIIGGRRDNSFHKANAIIEGSPKRVFLIDKDHLFLRTGTKEVLPLIRKALES